MRIEWSRDGRELLSCFDGTLRRHARGDAQILDGPNLLDARWRDDGSIVTIDDLNRLQRIRDGKIEALPCRAEVIVRAARITAADCYLARPLHGLFVSSFAGEELWAERYVESDAPPSLAISNDGKLVAFATETHATADFNYQRKDGRGWRVIETRTKAVLDRTYAVTKRVPGATQLAFDAAGRRLAIATPEPGPSLGVVRVGKDETYAREHVGGARAVALDDKGILAAYAYPRSIEAAPRRLRVDYLEPGAKGGSRIALVETLWIDPDLDDIVALAFDRASRRIACLDASGRIDVVPVP